LIDKTRYKTNKEGIELLKYIFHDSMSLYKKIAPNGWKNSEFVHFFHPTAKQQYEEYIRITENIKRMSKKQEKESEKPDKNEFSEDTLESVKEIEEFLKVLGLSVYDIFSNNHEVTGADGKVFDFGSLRGSGGFIADFFNYHLDNLSHAYDYLDFYMGSIWINERADLMPFYEFIFQKTKDYGCNWKYHFPRFYLINLGKIVGQDKDQKPSEYDPEKAILNDLKQKKEDKETKQMQEELDNSFREEYEEAKYKPPEKVVQAYKNIYGMFPEGHPQKEFE
jgi:hypothetical protein